MCRRIRMSMILHLEIKTSIINFRVPINQSFQTLFVIIANCHRNFTTGTARQTNNPLVIFLHYAVIDTRFIILTIHFRFCNQAAEILKANIIHREQRDMKALLIVSRITIFHIARCHIGLQPHNRLDACCIASLIEFH